MPITKNTSAYRLIDGFLRLDGEVACETAFLGLDVADTDAPPPFLNKVGKQPRTVQVVGQLTYDAFLPAGVAGIVLDFLGDS